MNFELHVATRLPHEGRSRSYIVQVRFSFSGQTIKAQGGEVLSRHRTSSKNSFGHEILHLLCGGGRLGRKVLSQNCELEIRSTARVFYEWDGPFFPERFLGRGSSRTVGRCAGNGGA